MEIMKQLAEFLKLPWWLQFGAVFLLLLVMVWMLAAAHYLYNLRPPIVETVRVTSEPVVKEVIKEVIVFREPKIEMHEILHISIQRRLQIFMDRVQRERETYPADVVAETFGDDTSQTVKFSLILREDLDFEKGAYTLDRALNKSGFLRVLTDMLASVREASRGGNVSCRAEIIGSSDGLGFDKRIGVYGGEVDLDLTNAVIDGVPSPLHLRRGHAITNSQLAYLRAFFTQRSIVARFDAERATTALRFSECKVSGTQTSRVGSEFRSVTVSLVFQNSDLRNSTLAQLQSN